MAKKLLAALCFALPAAASGEAVPTRVTLIPAPGADGLVRGVDGRTWKLSNPAKVVAAFNQARAVTENHASRLAAPTGGSSPAFGWIEKVEVENGAIVGTVAWNARGTTAVADREYRFISPEFIWEDKTTEVLAIVGASLVNDPNFPQLALNSEQFPQEQPPMLNAIAKALGLAESADESSCLSAISKLQTDKQTALNSAQHPDPQLFVPMATHQVALNAKTAAEGELKTQKAAQLEAEVAAAVDGALAAGKIVPATRDYYLGMCRAEGGLEKFNKFVELQPVIGEPTTTGKKPGAETTGAEGLSANQLAICSASGLDPKAYAESLKGLKA